MIEGYRIIRYRDGSVCGLHKVWLVGKTLSISASAVSFKVAATEPERLIKDELIKALIDARKHPVLNEPKKGLALPARRGRCSSKRPRGPIEPARRRRTGLRPEARPMITRSLRMRLSEAGIELDSREAAVGTIHQKEEKEENVKQLCIPAETLKDLPEGPYRVSFRWSRDAYDDWHFESYETNDPTQPSPMSIPDTADVRHIQVEPARGGRLEPTPYMPPDWYAKRQ